MHRRLCILLIAALFVPPTGEVAAAPAPPLHCTAFQFQKGQTILLGKNLDWDLGTGLLVTHGRGGTSGRRYGSVTANQFGTDLPLGGINEVGLVVEELSYSPARYPDAGSRPALDEFTWIQHQLDHHATVAGALAGLDDVAIERRWLGLHYLLADRTGDVAVVEFLDGQAVVHHGDDLFVPVLTNDTYANSVRYLRGHHGFGGERHETGGPESPERFVRAARGIRNLAGSSAEADPVGAAFTILDDVRQDDTQWSLVYDLRQPALHARVRGVAGTRVVQIHDLDLAAPSSPMVLDLTGAIAPAAMRSWTAWTPAIERQLREQVRDELGLDRTVEGVAVVPTAVGPSAELQLRHVQNAGVWIAHGDQSLLVDALFDLNAEPGKPPRLHDHMPVDSLAAFLRGDLDLGCVDATFATHDHDDHHQSGAAGLYGAHCPDAALVLPAAMAPAAGDRPDRVVPVAVEFGDVAPGVAGTIRFTALGLRHSGGRDGPSDRPHLGFVFHVGPWDVMHLGDAAPLAESLATLDRLASPGRRVVLAPYWFLSNEAGRRWLQERSAARLVVLLHVNRGNFSEVEQAVTEFGPTLPPLVLPRTRLETIQLVD